MTGRNNVLKEKVLAGSNQKEAQRKLVVRSPLVLEQRGLREHRHLEDKCGGVVPHKMESHGQLSGIGIAERGRRKRRA